MPAPTLALADVHRITAPVHGRERDIFVFDHHRTAFTLWCHAAAQLGRPLVLVTLDRHMDLGTPQVLAPDCAMPLHSLDLFARHSLAVSNDDHIVAALEAGAISDALVVARSHEPPSLEVFRPFKDVRGRDHRFVFAPTVAHVHEDGLALVREATDVVLDIDLDCFTTRSDGHFDEVLTWDAEQIEGFLQPPHAGEFWNTVLERTRLITLAREPYHCGGFTRGARLWIDFAEIFFRRVLGVPPP